MSIAYTQSKSDEYIISYEKKHNYNTKSVQ